MWYHFNLDINQATLVQKSDEPLLEPVRGEYEHWSREHLHIKAEDDTIAETKATGLTFYILGVSARIVM